jgi:hypothetical protein
MPTGGVEWSDGGLWFLMKVMRVQVQFPVYLLLCSESPFAHPSHLQLVLFDLTPSHYHHYWDTVLLDGAWLTVELNLSVSPMDTCSAIRMSGMKGHCFAGMLLNGNQTEIGKQCFLIKIHRKCLPH